MCTEVTYLDGAELTIVNLSDLPENLSSSITDTLQESSSLSGVSVEDFVLLKFDVEAIFMGGSYNSGGNDNLSVFIYAAFEEVDWYQLLMKSEGQKPIEGDFGQEYKGRKISSVAMAVSAQEMENTSDILKFVKEALTIKVCGE